MEETTTTSTRTATITCNVNYVTSLPGILRIVELVFGLLCWALTASVSWTSWSSAHQFVMFVSVTSWILTLILLIIYLAALHATTFSGAPWSIIEIVFNAFWSLFYFIASCVSAAYTAGYSVLAAATAFAFFTTILYIIHTVVSVRSGNVSFTFRSTTTTTTVNT